VEVTANGVRATCRGGRRAGCPDNVLIGVTGYSGNTQITVAPRQFALASLAGARYSPAPARQATRVVQPIDLLMATVLQPDDDTDFVFGTLMFQVPRGAGRFGLLWRGHHVATFVKTATGKLYETR
jgi:hypothetical protein